ncbi:MAG: hypothetical protein V2A58_09565 [Planctomycetota bacterium]
MSKEVMRRQASDNPYLHKDFHGALSAGIEYLHRNFGEDAVREYLLTFARSYYAPLARAIEGRGLVALREHLEKVYRTEGVDFRVRFSLDELVLEVDACPAVSHMRRHGYPVARLWRETTRTVNEAICEGTPYAAELLEYDEETGRSVQRFARARP